VTGVDSADQLFRDNAPVTFLKGQKCIYLSRFKPAPGGSVMIEIRAAGDAWRSNAKVRGVSPAGSKPDSFRVTVELDRAHTLVIEAADDPAPRPAAAEESQTPSADAAIDNEPDAPDTTQETAAPASLLPSAGKKGSATDGPIKPASAPTPAARAVVADVVRSVMAAEVEQWKAGLREEIADAVQAALRQPLQKIEAKIEQHLQKRSAVTEESVRKIAAQEAENAQMEWASTSHAAVTEAVRSAMAADGERQRREVRALVSSEVETALQGPLATRMNAKVETTVDARFEEHSRKRPAVTEETARRLAAEVAQSVQLEWASTKLQKMVAEVVRSSLAAESAQRRTEATALVSSEVESAIRGPIAARIDAAIETTLATKIKEHFQSPSAVEALQKAVTEAVGSALAAESGQRRSEITAMISSEVEAAARGPIAARIDAAIETTLTTKIKEYFQTPSADEALQELVAEAVHRPLEAEYERRGREVQAVVSGQIEAAVRGPIASHMDEMLRKALEAQRAEYLRTPPPITEETIRKITANIAKHPQLQSSMNALAANLTERWTEIARSATATAQKDMNSRIADTERLANQVVLDIQQKLNSFNLEMSQILGPPESVSSDGSAQPADQPEREKRFRELLQSTGANFEREMKAALQKIFGGS
jgi:hypothetical protein